MRGKGPREVAGGRREFKKWGPLGGMGREAVEVKYREGGMGRTGKRMHERCGCAYIGRLRSTLFAAPSGNGGTGGSL